MKFGGRQQSQAAESDNFGVLSKRSNIQKDVAEGDSSMDSQISPKQFQEQRKPV